jgi:hypothetical protein
MYHTYKIQPACAMIQRRERNTESKMSCKFPLILCSVQTQVSVPTRRNRVAYVSTVIARVVGSQQQTNLVPSLATSSSRDVSRITNIISVA